MRRYLRFYIVFAVGVLSWLPAAGRAYYVSAEGNDAARGTSPAEAWSTLSRVREAALVAGDSILFRSGDVFRGYLTIAVSGTTGAPVYYGSYGIGSKPIIEPSVDASSWSKWERAGRKLWRFALETSDVPGNIIFNHGVRGCARRMDSLEELQGCDLAFAYAEAEKVVYLVSKRNPGRRFSSIEIALTRPVVRIKKCNDICLEGLCIRYGAAHGVGCSEVKRLEIRNCDICWIGGGILYRDERGRGVRYGNGIELWSAADSVTVEGCRVWECYDAALTNQSKNPHSDQKNIIWRNNEVWNCEYSYEYWNQGEESVTENILFENNLCRDAGKGWGHSQRWNPNAAHLMFYDNTASTSGFTVRGNRFVRTENCGIRLFNAWYDDIEMTDNTWILPQNLLCRYHGRPVDGLTEHYPDELDRTHKDDKTEIERQAVEPPLVLGHGRKALQQLYERFGFR